MQTENRIPLLLRLLYILLGVLLVYPALAGMQYGIDGAWILTLNKIISQHTLFGREVYFTYGPLGFLSTRLPLYISPIAFVVFDALYTIGILWALYKMWRRLPLPAWAGLLPVILCLLCLSGLYLDMALVLFFLFVFLVSEEKKHVLWLAAPVALLTGFIKVNAGIFLLWLFPLAVIYYLYRKRLGFKEGLSLLLLFGFGYFLCCWLLHVAPVGYQVGALHLIASYADVMYMPAGQYNPILYVWMAVGLGLCIMVLLGWQWLRRHAGPWLMLLVGIYLFILYKSSMVRLDHKHVLTFFSLFPLVVLFLLYRFIYWEKWARVLLFSLLIVSTFVTLRSKARWETITEKPSRLADYFPTLLHHKDVSLFVPPDSLPLLMQRQVAGKTVDALPIALPFIFKEDIRYVPSPALQYEGWDAWLLNRNAAFFEDDGAPEYIVYKNAQLRLDDRYAWYGESLLSLALLTHYTLKDTSGPYMLFQRKQEADELIKQRFAPQSYQLGDTLRLRDTGLLMLRARVLYSFPGHLRRMIYQPPNLRIALQMEDKHWEDFRLPVSFLQKGIIVNKRVDGPAMRALFFNSMGKANSSIIAIRIYSPQAWGFDQVFRVYFSQLKISHSY